MTENSDHVCDPYGPLIARDAKKGFVCINLADSRMHIPDGWFFRELSVAYPERFAPPAASQSATEPLCECGHHIGSHRPIEGGCDVVAIVGGQMVKGCDCPITQLDRIEAALAALTANMEAKS